MAVSSVFHLLKETDLVKKKSVFFRVGPLNYSKKQKNIFNCVFDSFRSVNFIYGRLFVLELFHAACVSLSSKGSTMDCGAAGMMGCLGKPLTPCGLLSLHGRS